MDAASTGAQLEILLRIHSLILPPATSIYQQSEKELYAWFPTGHRLRLTLLDAKQRPIAQLRLLRPKGDDDLSGIFEVLKESAILFPEGAYI